MNGLRSKKRLLGICRLQSKMARSHLAKVETEVAQLEQSRGQISAMADDMLGIVACDQSDILAARLEFGHRLISLDHIQKRKIAEAQKAAVSLRSSVHRSTLREERAMLNARQANKYQDQKNSDRQPQQSGKLNLATKRLKRGLS